MEFKEGTAIEESKKPEISIRTLGERIDHYLGGTAMILTQMNLHPEENYSDELKRRKTDLMEIVGLLIDTPNGYSKEDIREAKFFLEHLKNQDEWTKENFENMFNELRQMLRDKRSKNKENQSKL